MKFKYVVVIWLLFILVHIINILQFPIFEDEAEYLLLASAIVKDPLHNFFIYSLNGLFPLFGWLVALVSIFLHDTLLSGRLINVLLVSSLVFWFNRIAKLYNLPQKFEWFAQILLLTSPIILLNSRIALLDSSVLVFIAWYIYFADSYLKNHFKRSAIGIFIMSLAAMFTKATGIFGVPAVALIIFRSFKLSNSRKAIFNSISILVASFLVSYVYFSFFGKQIGADSGSSLSVFSSPSEFISAIKLRSLVTFIWLKVYYLPFFIIPAILFLRRKKYFELNANMIIWAITSLVIMIFLNRFYFPRHILILSVPLIVLFSTLLLRLKKPVAILIFSITLLFQTYNSYQIIKNPQSANLALEDKFEYFENYTSGSKITDISEYLARRADGQNIVVWLDGSYVMEYGLRRSLPKNIIIKSFRLDENYTGIEPQSVYESSTPSYVVVNRWRPRNIGQLKLITEFPVSFRHTQFVYQIP